MNLILNEVELMERVRSGDADAFQIIAERYHNRVATYFIRCGVPPDVADDLTQATLMRMFRHGSRYGLRTADDGAVETLLFIFARWVRCDQARRDIARNDVYEQYARVALAEAEAADAKLRSEEIARVVNAAVDALPPLQRLVIKWHHLEEQPLEDVARRSGMSVHNVRGYLYRARTTLRVLLAPWWKGVRHDQL